MNNFRTRIGSKLTEKMRFLMLRVRTAICLAVETKPVQQELQQNNIKLNILTQNFTFRTWF